MRIAVIGDYESPDYKDLLLKVKVIMPDEYILDLSRHKGTYMEMRDARWADIDSAHHVAVCEHWMEKKSDVRRDIDKAKNSDKSMLFFQDGKLTTNHDFAYRG